jgi:hypothetical protein
MLITDSMIRARMAARYGTPRRRNGMAVIYAAWFATWAGFVVWALLL